MFSHIMVGANDLEASKKFYDAVLGTLGVPPAITDENGYYHFRTIKPVAYPGRTPHIHVAVKMKGREKWTTQCYIKGHPGNEKDGIWKSIRDEKVRAAITVDFVPLKGTRAGELAAKFDIVLGTTPEV